MTTLAAAETAARALESRLRRDLAPPPLETKDGIPAPQAGDPAPPHLVEVFPFGAGHAQTWLLANGLRLILAPDPSIPVVAVHTWVRVGSAHEVAGKTGLAHLFEHLMFKATKNRPAGVFDRVLEQLGASANAATWLDWTCYHETIPPEHLPAVLDMEADRLAFLDLTPAAFRAELEVVRNERREAVDNDADGLVQEALAKALWGADHPYGRPTLGHMADLERMKLPDAIAFYRQHYVPGRVTVVLTGAVDTEAALLATLQHHGRLPAAGHAERKDGTSAPPAIPAATAKLAQVTVAIDAGADRLAVAWRTVPAGHVDQPVLTVLAELLADADSARLSRHLVFDHPLASSADATELALQAGGAFEIHLTMLPGKSAGEGLAAVDAVLQDLMGARPVSEAEVAAAKNRLRMEHFQSLTGVDGRAEALGWHQATLGDPKAHAAFWAAVARVAPADVLRVARLYLKGPRAIVTGAAPRERATARPRKTRAT